MKYNLIKINNYNQELRCEYKLGMYYFCCVKCKLPFNNCTFQLPIELIYKIGNHDVTWAIQNMHSNNIMIKEVAKYIIEN
jgi:hypothetical protein